MKRSIDVGDGWYESEEPMRLGMITELQRMRERARKRPIRVALLAITITGLVTYKLATRVPLVEAEVVLALSQGDFGVATHAGGLKVDQLKEDFVGKLLPDDKLIELIERRDLFRLRRKLGNKYALEELKSNLEVEIWRNSFAYFDDDGENAPRSARIGITYSDADPDRAYGIARDLAGIAIDKFEERRLDRAQKLALTSQVVEADTRKQLDQLEHAISLAQTGLADAQKKQQIERATTLGLRMITLERRKKRLDEQMAGLVRSNDTFADKIAAAGLDIKLAIVDEHVPEHDSRSIVTTIALLIVIGSGALLASILLVGAFDSRIHDTSDVSRLGLPVLGHVPGFSGDNVGAMRSRGVVRARVPSSERWRSQ